MKKKRILLALDADGTMTLTAKYLRLWAIEEFKRLDMHDALEYALAHPEQSTLLWPKYMRDITDQCVLQGDFMIHVEPSELVTKGLFDQLDKLQRRRTHVALDVVVCTHRGFHEKGESNTESWLKDHDKWGVVEKVHAIDPAEHPNKLLFLEQHYPDHDIHLLDDNPLFRSNEVHPRDDRLCIYSEEGNLPCYDNQIQFPGLHAYINFLELKMVA
uniref:5'(3')-deoxyribonucleotidase n=1 Tax=Pantoea phage Survivor TaxID=3232176 RepID=A0AAU8L0Q8_9CAUD